jgi:tetratricopeptide (TPR) repeat protein
LLPYKHPLYSDALKSAISDREETAETLKNIYDFHIQNVKTVAGNDNLLAIADETAHFGLYLGEKRRFDAALPYLRGAIAAAERRHLRSIYIGNAYFAMAQLVERNKQLGPPDQAERYYREAISLYNPLYGIDAVPTQEVRAQFLRFYIRNNRLSEARDLLDQFKRDLATSDESHAKEKIIQLEQLVNEMAREK